MHWRGSGPRGGKNVHVCMPFLAVSPTTKIGKVLGVLGLCCYHSPCVLVCVARLTVTGSWAHSPQVHRGSVAHSLGAHRAGSRRLQGTPVPRACPAKAPGHKPPPSQATLVKKPTKMKERPLSGNLALELILWRFGKKTLEFGSTGAFCKGDLGGGGHEGPPPMPRPKWPVSCLAQEMMGILA